MNRTGFLLLLVMLAAPAGASTLQQLMAEDKLRLTSWLSPPESIVIGQEVRLIIEVSTPRWFAGGTRIVLPEVADAVVLRRNEFATNISRREGATTWVVQQWQLELYPQQPGRYRVPEIDLGLAVNDADHGIVRGALATTSLEFVAVVPDILAGVDTWVATPTFSVEQVFDRELTALQPGDALTQTITLRASRVSAMMLPAPGHTELPGLAAYAALPELENRSNRGEATAIRRQTVTYVVERPGQYRLRGESFHWWNTESGKLELATLPAVTLDAGEPGWTAHVPTLSPIVGWGFVAAILLGLAIFFTYRQRSGSTIPGRGLRRRQALRALRSGDRQNAVTALYAWLNSRAGEPGWLSLRNTVAGYRDESAMRATEDLLDEVYSEAARQAASSRKLEIVLRRGSAPTEPGQADQPRFRPPLNPSQPRK
jgi:hypothetical protein